MDISVAIIGSGSMGKWHTYAYDRLNEFYGNELHINKKVICSRNLVDLTEKNSRLKWQECVVDWREVVSRPDIDVVDISTPDYLHYEIAKTAMENGKHVICEKPLVSNADEAIELCRLSEAKGVSTATMFNYRYLMSITIMKRLIDNGIIGDIVHVNGSFIFDFAVNPDIPMFWRFDANCCPTGILGDAGSHLIDLSRFLGLNFVSVSGVSNTVVKERKNADLISVPVKIDDITLFTSKFTNGAVGNFETSRVSGGRGRNNLIFEVHGTKGNIKFEKGYINDLALSIGSQYGENGEYKRYSSNEIYSIPYPWSDTCEFVQSDSFTLLIYDFIKSITNKKPINPTFNDGYEACKVISAVRESIENGIIVKL